MNNSERQTIDIERVVGYLSHSFANATKPLGSKAVRTVEKGRVTTTALYDYQVNFCYLIDAMQRGPVYIAPKMIQRVNDLIEEVKQYVRIGR